MLPICPVKSILVDKHIKMVTRKLPVQGEIFVKKGDQLKPEDIIGECKVLPGFRVFNLSESLGVIPKEVPSCLLKKIGSHIYKGNTVASSVKFWGLQKREFISPVAGILDNLNEKGQITIKFFPETVRFPAGAHGIVKEIFNSESVVIETAAIVIKGVLGIGYSRGGSLSILGGPEEITASSLVEASLAGKILICGALLTKDLIQKALSIGVKGIIGGGMHLRDFRGVSGTFSSSEDVGLSLMITGAYGKLPLEKKVYDTLSNFEQHYAILDPKNLELIIPLSFRDLQDLRGKKIKKEENKMEILEKGMAVRVLSWPHLGKIGMVEEVEEELKLYESGLRDKVVRVSLAGDLKIQVPPQNLEIIA